MASITIKTKGMHCGSCEMLVADGLEEIAGINGVKSSHETGEVTVDFDDSMVKISEIKEAIKAEGYEVLE